MSDQGAAQGGPVRPVVALALASISFVALLIFGLGMLSLALNADVIAFPGLGPIPGFGGVVVALAAFAAVLWRSLRRARAAHSPSYIGAAWTALACAAAYVVGVWIAVLFAAGDLAVATAVAGRLVTSWFAAVVLVAGAVAAWGGIALVRTRARRPRWPWEDEFDE